MRAILFIGCMPLHRDIPQVALLVTTSNDWGRRIIKGILSYANEVGPWHIWVKSDESGPARELPGDWHGDGVIARVASPALAADIQASGLPVVNVADFPIEGFSAPCVRTDDQAGTRMAVDFFIDHGFRHVAYVGSRHTANPVWYGSAFQAALSLHGIRAREFYFEGELSAQAGPFMEWLLALPKPVGVMAWGLGLGRMVVDCCMEAGISVPHDIAVLCGSYDDLLSYACFPALSGILNPTELIGYKAAQLLHRMMQGERVPCETHYLPPLGIMERLSTDTLAVEDPKIAKVVAFVKEHAFEPIGMVDILRAVPMARRSLERKFQQIFGRSPTEEIRRIRMDRARRLLAETDLPMQQIAEACGYSTYNYLTHVFKQVTGTTPRDYRKRMRLVG